MRFKAARPCEDVDNGGIGEEVVGAEGVVLGPMEETEGKMGIVFYAEGNVGKFGRGEACGVERLKEVPAALGSLLCENRNDGGD